MGEARETPRNRRRSLRSCNTHHGLPLLNCSFARIQSQLPLPRLCGGSQYPVGFVTWQGPGHHRFSKTAATKMAYCDAACLSRICSRGPLRNITTVGQFPRWEPNTDGTGNDPGAETARRRSIPSSCDLHGKPKGVSIRWTSEHLRNLEDLTDDESDKDELEPMVSLPEAGRPGLHICEHRRSPCVAPSPLPTELSLCVCRQTIPTASSQSQPDSLDVTPLVEIRTLNDFAHADC